MSETTEAAAPQPDVPQPAPDQPVGQNLPVLCRVMFTRQEVELVLEGLGQLPAARVADLYVGLRSHAITTFSPRTPQ